MPATKFIKKLQDLNINTLVDVRSIPYSHRAKQFNRETLATLLAYANIEYLYRGKNLGGLEENVDFSETITEISTLSEKKKIALMCSEGNYKKCHRYIMLTPEFERKGIKIEHIVWSEENKITQQILFSG